MNLDIDELMEDRFAEVLPELMNRSDVDIYQFPSLISGEIHGRSG